jgi:hypothetical protein
MMVVMKRIIDHIIDKMWSLGKIDRTKHHSTLVWCNLNIRCDRATVLLRKTIQTRTAQKCMRPCSSCDIYAMQTYVAFKHRRSRLELKNVTGWWFH